MEPAFYQAPAKRADDGGTLSLFDADQHEANTLGDRAPGWASSWGALTDAQRLAQRERWKEQLLPIVRELAARTTPEGVTASEVLAEGCRRSLLWGERSFLTKYPRIYAWIGGWLRQLAGDGVLAAKTVDLPGGGTLAVTRESERKLSHSNKNVVYVRGTT